MDNDTTTPHRGKPRIRFPEGYLREVVATVLPMMSMGLVIAVSSGGAGETALTAYGILLILAHLAMIILMPLSAPRGRRIGWGISALVITGIDYWIVAGIFQR